MEVTTVRTILHMLALYALAVLVPGMAQAHAYA